MLTLRDCFVIVTLLGIALALTRREAGDVGVFILFAPGAFAVWSFLRRRSLVASPFARNMLVRLAGAASTALLLCAIEWGRRQTEPLTPGYPDLMYFPWILIVWTAWGAIISGLLSALGDRFVRDSRQQRDR